MAGLAHQRGATGASHCLPQEWASLALVTTLLANVQEVPRGASKLPSRAQLTVSLGTKGPTCIPIPSHLPGGAGAALWPPTSKTSHGRLCWVVPRGQVFGCALKPAFGFSPRHVRGP